MFTVDRNGDGVFDSEDDGNEPYGYAIAGGFSEIAKRLKTEIEAAAKTPITCGVCLGCLQSIKDSDSIDAKKLTGELLVNLQLSPDVRESIGGVAKQAQWLEEIIIAVINESTGPS